MSLKAKIEAVIYASEEPVTLAQLTGLLGQEAQAELEHRDSAQRSLSLADRADQEAASSDDPNAMNDEVIGEPESVPPEERPEPSSAETEAPSLGVEQAFTTVQPDKKAAREERARAQRLRSYFRSLLEELTADYATSSRGLEVREVAGGYRLATKPEYHDAVRGFVKSLKPPLKLTLQALETLAVVAYKQPVTAPEISEIRGVDSGGVLGSLMARKLITTAGRKQVIGRPMLYKTTKDFLLRFGLKDIAELPSIEEFEKMAGELVDAEPIQEEIPMADTTIERITDTNFDEERDLTQPQADGDNTPLSEEDVVTDDLAAVNGQIQASPDTVATPEGDNEFAPDQPLKPAPEGLQRVPAIDTNKV